MKIVFSTKNVKKASFIKLCKYAYEYNNKAEFVCADISNLDSKEIKKFYNKNDIKILVGCAPCQTFSKQTNKYKDRKF